jgi:pSer/pThr/pTyr-binding forkhead associated (FHA) protein
MVRTVQDSGSAMKQVIRLRGISGDIQGKDWESDSVLRIGKDASLEIVLDEVSVSRKHAELKFTPQGWMVRDLESTNGTFINGIRLESDERPLRSRNIVQFGKSAMIVELNYNATSPALAEEQMRAEAASRQSRDCVVSGLTFDRNQCPRPGEQLLAVFRAGHHLVHLESETELLYSVLNDVVAVLNAQRETVAFRVTNVGQNSSY